MIKKNYCPIDLLPIKRPLEDDYEYPDNYFYEQVVKHLIQDIVKIEANGIPIDLKQVEKLEYTLETVIDNVTAKLANNPIIQKYLNQVDKQDKKDQIKTLKSKIRTSKDYIVDFNPKNITHRTYVVNEYLKQHNYYSKLMDKWLISDLKKLNQIIGSKFISDYLNNNIQSYMQPIIEQGMYSLAKDKADIYNKTKVQDKIQEVKIVDNTKEFNPGSALQKQELFKMLNIESESETVKGNPQWNREEIEKLLEKINYLLKED